MLEWDLLKRQKQIGLIGTAMYYSGIALLVAIFGTLHLFPIWFPHRLAKKITDGAETNFPYV